MSTEYSIWDGTLCYSKGYPTIKEACDDAERYIRSTQVCELFDDITIREGMGMDADGKPEGKIVRTFRFSIDWR